MVTGNLRDLRRKYSIKTCLCHTHGEFPTNGRASSLLAKSPGSPVHRHKLSFAAVHSHTEDFTHSCYRTHGSSMYCTPRNLAHVNCGCGGVVRMLGLVGRESGSVLRRLGCDSRRRVDAMVIIAIRHYDVWRCSHVRHYVRRGDGGGHAAVAISTSEIYFFVKEAARYTIPNCLQACQSIITKDRKLVNAHRGASTSVHLSTSSPRVSE
ncbi:hypothetical protein BKA93DRAFT_876930 [Sparassis latifolia]